MIWDSASDLFYTHFGEYIFAFSGTFDEKKPTIYLDEMLCPWVLLFSKLI